MDVADPLAALRTRSADQRLYNFCAGPAALPLPVLEELQEELPVYHHEGASMLEISHRSDAYDAVEESARHRIKSLLGLDDAWQVLFLQGGASMQFHQVPLNMLPPDGSADYLLTGRWSENALEEAQLLGTARAATSSADKNHTYIPEVTPDVLDPDAAYVHFTSNNTIYGTQYRTAPAADVPLVVDASSDFLSRPMDMDRYGLIYAGAQKNVGPAGVVIVLVKDSFLAQRNQPLPTMLDYGTHARKRFNTPPVFAIYLVEKVMRWLESHGGVGAMAQRNEQKAARLYNRIDRTDFYTGTTRIADRSLMNATFSTPSEALDTQFCREAEAAGLLALKGHRSVGGIRASIYNACPPEAVEALVQFMDHFEAVNG